MILIIQLKYRLADWIKKKTKQINKKIPSTLTGCCLQETHLACKYIQILKVKRWKMPFQANGT
jgi:hypothetical protein